MFSLKQTVADAVKGALEDAQNEVARRFRKIEHYQQEVTSLREELETLRIEKDRANEEFERRDRKIGHKIGLERARQEFDVEQARREAAVEIREQNLAADKERLAEQMEFHRKRLEDEVTSLRELTGKLLERLPSAEIITTIARDANAAPARKR